MRTRPGSATRTYRRLVEVPATGSPSGARRRLGTWVPPNLAVAALPGPDQPGRSLALGFKPRSRELRLPNDTQQGAPSDRIVKRNGDGYRGCLQTLLHDPMAPALAHSGESVLFEKMANLRV